MEARTLEYSIGTVNPIKTHESTQKKNPQTLKISVNHERNIRALIRNLNPHENP